MTPPDFEGSDGFAELAESLIAVQLIRPGVYVVMPNHVYPVHRVRKDHKVEDLSGQTKRCRPPEGGKHESAIALGTF
jgi:hypothetical protein